MRRSSARPAIYNLLLPQIERALYMATPRNFTLLAGRQAAALIREEGFSADQIEVLAGASGGPKWLILSALDRLLFGQLLRHRQAPLHAIGSSIGSWRMACLATADPAAAITRLEQAYIEQRYPADVTPAMVSAEGERILTQLLGPHEAADLLQHAWVRLHILAVRCQGLCASEQARLQMLGFGLAALGNLFSRRGLARRLTRVVFHNAGDSSPFSELADLPTAHVPLTADNLRPALLASGSIPLVLEGVRGVPGAAAGVYRDGGVIDYHLDFDYGAGNGLIFYPHFYPYIVPGWFDKALPWRRADGRNFQRALLLVPSPALVARLPYGKIPDRRDFVRLSDTERIRYWRQVVAEGERLADEFGELLTKERLAGALQPLF